MVELQNLIDVVVYHAFGIAEQDGTVKRIARVLEEPVNKRQWRGRRGVFGSNVRSFSEGVVEQIEEWKLDEFEAAVSKQDQPLCLREVTSLRRINTRSSQGERPYSELVARESAPFLTPYLLDDTGLEKHREWEKTWTLQRRQDRGENVGEIPLPPKYVAKDFRGDYWKLRKQLDVPKERFISYPGCESDKDNEPIYGWAGWDHAQRAQALAALYVDRKDNEGWSPERLQPMLAGLLELLPWVKQWHPEPDPDTGEPFGDFLETFLEGECHALGFTYDDLRAWRPPKKTRRKKTSKKKASKKKAAKKANDS